MINSKTVSGEMKSIPKVELSPIYGISRVKTCNSKAKLFLILFIHFLGYSSMAIEKVCVVIKNS